MSQPPIQAVRLTQEQFNELAKHFKPIWPNEATTEIQVAYNLGAQAVLNKLREGWVIENVRTS